jgi:hypothetical protein
MCLQSFQYSNQLEGPQNEDDIPLPFIIADCSLKPVTVKIDHHDLGGRIELRCEQGREAAPFHSPIGDAAWAAGTAVAPNEEVTNPNSID